MYTKLWPLEKHENERENQVYCEKQNVCTSWDSKFFCPLFGSQYFPFPFFNTVSTEVFFFWQQNCQVTDVFNFLQNVTELQSDFLPFVWGMFTFQTLTQCTQWVIVLLYNMLHSYCLQPGFFFSLSLTKCPRANIFCSLSVSPGKKFPGFCQNSEVLL